MALKQSKFAEAVSLYAQAIGLDPTNHVYYSNRSSALCSLEKFDKALADAQKCVALKPDWAKAHLRLAGAYSGQGRSWELKTKEAIELLPDKYGFQPKVVLSARAPPTITATAVDVPMHPPRSHCSYGEQKG